jgi:hypothetical protein
VRRARILAVVAIGFLLFAGLMLRATGGRLSLPVDDSFIYFQYARQAAAGHFLSYQSGEAPTTGATSLPWLALLTLGSLLGFDGKAILVFALLVGGLLFALAAKATGDAERSLLSHAEPVPRIWGISFAGALVLLSGPLQWAAWSGMEIALFAATLAATFAAFARAEGKPGAVVAGWAALLALMRPEGALLAGTLAALWLLQALLTRFASRAWLWLLLPLAAACVQPLVNLLATGDVRSSGFLSKSLFAAPGADVVAIVRIALLRAASLAVSLFGGVSLHADGLGLYAYDSEAAALFVPPLSGVFFVIGILPALQREWQERRVGAGWLALVWIGTVLVATATLEEPDAHFSRYQMPILPLFLLYTAVGVARLARALANAGGGLARLAGGARLWLLLGGFVSVLFYAGAYADNCEDIDRMQIALGETLRESLEPEAVVAINDAGALAYFSGRRTVDLVGLTTPGFAGLWADGSGALWEKLESLPENGRPGWFCFFPNWFEFEDLGILRRQGSVRLLTPSIVDAEKVLARADWSLAGSGHEPRLLEEGAGAGRVLDRLDVADVTSERAHRFRARQPERGAGAASFARRSAFADGDEAEAIDGGRTIFGEIDFEIARSPQRLALLVARTVTGVRQRLLVSVDGGPEEPVLFYRSGAGRFYDQALVTLAPGAGAAVVRVRVSPAAASSAPLILFHLFSLETADE